MTTTGTDVLLEERIAAQAKVPVEDVRYVFAEYGLPLVVSPALPRSLRLHRMRVAGVRTGEVQPGEFDTTLSFSSGLTALVASNFRGKTSVLELVTWCLRGSPKDLKKRVRGWLRHVDLDATVAGQPMAFRLDLTDGEIASAVVLTGPDTDALKLVRAPDPARGITPLLRASTPESYAEQVAVLMLRRMDLQSLVNSFKGTSTKTHGWPAYFGAVYLPAGGNETLLGDVSMDGLPGRLLQVFLDLPAAAALTRVKAVRDVRLAERKARTDAAVGEAAERASERERLEADLARAEERLAGLAPFAEGEESLVDLAQDAVRLAREVADAQDVWDEASQLFRRARAARQRDAKLLNDVTESATARLLFHGLDPTSCPRCDKAIDEERRQQERHARACAVCAREVTDDNDGPQEIADEAQARLELGTEAERDAKAELKQAEDAVDRLTGELGSVQESLRRAQSAADLPARLAAREDVLRLQGALSVFREPDPVPEDPAEARAIKVLTSAAKILDKDSKIAADALFKEINEEIAALATLFGVDSVESVAIDRAARLKIKPVGSEQEWFSDQTPGGRLRLRIAVAIALLRVGAAQGVSTHPGLLLIDSPKSEEVQPADAEKLLKELAAVAAESGLQVVITTADFDLVQAALPDENVLKAKSGASLW